MSCRTDVPVCQLSFVPCNVIPLWRQQSSEIKSGGIFYIQFPRQEQALDCRGRRRLIIVLVSQYLGAEWGSASVWGEWVMMWRDDRHGEFPDIILNNFTPWNKAVFCIIFLFLYSLILFSFVVFFNLFIWFFFSPVFGFSFCKANKNLRSI